MFYIEKKRVAQALEFLSPWVSDAHRLTPAEIAGEALVHQILVSISRPEPSEWMIALAAVLALPPASPGRGKVS